MVSKKVYRTVGVVPPATTEIYRNEDGEWMRDGGATWDASKRAWRRTLWKLTEPMYKVTYNDGTVAVLKEKPEIIISPIDEDTGGEPVDPIHKPIDPVPIQAEEVPASWELATEYVSSGEKPEWDGYMAREIIGIEPIVAPLPQCREGGGDWLQQKVNRAKKIAGIPTVAVLR